MTRCALFVLFLAAALPLGTAPLAAQEPDVHAASPAAAHDEAAHTAEAEHGSDNPILWATDLALWTLIVFLVLLFVLGKFAWGPLTRALDAREASIRKSVEDAEHARREAERLLGEHQKKLDAVQGEVRAILDEARRDAQHTSQQILREAQEEARAIRDRSRREIEQARDQALKEIWDQAARLVREASGKVIGRTLSEKDHQRIIEESLAEFSGQSAN